MHCRSRIQLHVERLSTRRASASTLRRTSRSLQLSWPASIHSWGCQPHPSASADARECERNARQPKVEQSAARKRATSRSFLARSARLSAGVWRDPRTTILQKMRAGRLRVTNLRRTIIAPADLRTRVDALQERRSSSCRAADRQRLSSWDSLMLLGHFLLPSTPAACVHEPGIDDATPRPS